MYKLELANDLSDAERTAVERLLTKVTDVAAGYDIASEGHQASHATVLLEGLACRYRHLTDGARQIISFQVSGDWVDLHSYFLRTRDHSVGAVSRCRIVQVPHPQLKELIETFPRVGQALWRMSMIDSSVFREWVVNIGRRDAYERVGHLLCELHTRLCSIGQVTGYSFELPLTQADLADAVGVSTVHVNRVLQKLKGEGLVTFGGRSVVIHDWNRLAEISGFNAAYLHLNEGSASVGLIGPLARIVS